MRSDSSSSMTAAVARPRRRDGPPVVFVAVVIVSAARLPRRLAVDDSSLQPSAAVVSKTTYRAGGCRALTDAAEDAPAVLVATAASCVPRVHALSTCQSRSSGARALSLKVEAHWRAASDHSGLHDP